MRCRRGVVYTPTALTVTPSGELYIGNDFNGEIVGFNSSGVQNATYAGAGTGNGQFNYRFGGLAVDSSGNIWGSDYADSRIEELSSSGAYITQFGSQGSGNGQFVDPLGLAVSSSRVVSVVDQGDNRVEQFQEPPTP